MPYVSWSDEYNINVGEIDTQHKKMLELVNDIHSEVEDRVDKEILLDLLFELVEYTRMHFSTEEELMKTHDYPEFKKHHIDHKMLLQYMNDLVAEVSSGKKPVFYSDYDISSDWALIHISEHDKSLGTFLNSKGVY